MAVEGWHTVPFSLGPLLSGDPTGGHRSDPRDIEGLPCIRLRGPPEYQEVAYKGEGQVLLVEYVLGCGSFLQIVCRLLGWEDVYLASIWFIAAT